MNPKIVKLTPPRISAETIGEKIVCTRPMREDKFNISIEKKQSKTIIHCYGHGGSGWTTLFGSVNSALSLFEQTQPNRNSAIRIIGAGCMGLAAAIELASRGYLVAGIFTKSLYDMPSWRTAGYFALVSVLTSATEEDSLFEMGLNTFKTYQKVEQGMHPYISCDAVHFLPVYCSTKTLTGLEKFAAQGVIPPPEPVSLDFGNGVKHHDHLKYMTYFLNTTELMQQMTAEISRLNIPIIEKTVHSFEEIQEKVIFNCSGIGAKELNEDDKMIPVRGHLMTLKSDAGHDHMKYMIYTTVMQEGKEEYVYLFPKDRIVLSENSKGIPCAGVLGGTFIAHANKLSIEDQKKLDAEEFQRLLDRHNLFFFGTS
jgi:D-amino-acid oxidase